MTVASTNMEAPARTAWCVPFLSAYRPTSGLNAYMPATCSDTTNWLSDSCPCNFMCTGVIAITATMVTCEMTIEASASRPFCVATTIAKASLMLGSFTVPFGLMPPAITNGSGRKRIDVLRNAPSRTMPENTHGPVYFAQPNQSWPATSAGEMSNGPKTAPKVEAKIMRLIARARLCGSAKSVAAYRASKFDACPLPNKNRPTINSASERC
ncbi:unannotated protein [freshwater metagenome]|uniref:Unannotated protein n=1 Tax=freshwater metagenome TaxID=449393 RepID=A0A6J6VJK4_9ZZZZ